MPSPQRIAVLFAVAQELMPLARRLELAEFATTKEFAGSLVRQGTLERKQLLLVAGGMGQKRAAAAAESLVRTWRPELLVMAGVAGALASDLHIAEVVSASAISTGSECFIPDLVPTRSHGSHHTGALLSLDRVLVTAQDKRAALASVAPPQPLAVEMESAAVARVAIRHALPWAAVRAVSDSADESLPLDFNRLRTEEGDLATARIALAAMTNPGAIPGLIRLGKNTSLAAEALAGFLQEWIQSL